MSRCRLYIFYFPSLCVRFMLYICRCSLSLFFYYHCFIGFISDLLLTLGHAKNMRYEICVEIIGGKGPHVHARGAQTSEL